MKRKNGKIILILQNLTNNSHAYPQTPTKATAATPIRSSAPKSQTRKQSSRNNNNSKRKQRRKSSSEEEDSDYSEDDDYE